MACQSISLDLNQYQPRAHVGRLSGRTDYSLNGTSNKGCCLSLIAIVPAPDDGASLLFRYL
jgi:hypothetical protein